jgi:hypothetical protein
VPIVKNQQQQKVTRKAIKEIPQAKLLHPTVRNLLFLTSGTVDVTAASDNASWSDTDKGGLFTRSLSAMLIKPVKLLDIDRDGIVTWREFFPQLQKETEIVFRSWKRELTARGEKIDGDTQKPHSFSLGGRTYAVVGIENSAAEPLVYRWRWQGQEQWNEVKLEHGKQKVHFLVVLEDAETLPRLEVEIKGRGKGKLKASKWTGDGGPSFDDGKTYSIESRKKRS